MIIEQLSPRPVAPIAPPFFLFDANLKLIGADLARGWPVAVLTVLSANVRRAVADGDTVFQPLGGGPEWRIITVGNGAARRLAVFVDAT